MSELQKRLRGRPRNFHNSSTPNRIQSLERALDVLDCLAAGSGMSLSEIAEKLQQSPATVFRILTTLETRKVVEMDTASQVWFIGPSSFQLGSAFLRRTGIVERARPLMRQLMEETGETANLGIETSGEIMFISQVETHENIRAFFPPGARSPLHASGIGKALLAHADQSRINKYLAGEDLESFTEKTISDKDALHDELIRIKLQGYAFDNEEKSIGMRCVAAPVFNIHGEATTGISISGPSSRLPMGCIKTTGKLVMQKAELLSTHPEA